jgi:hypothetical protein
MIGGWTPWEEGIAYGGACMYICSGFLFISMPTKQKVLTTEGYSDFENIHTSYVDPKPGTDVMIF